MFHKEEDRKGRLAEGMGTIIDLLQPKPGKRGRNDGISILGDDKYVFVHI